MTNVFSDLLQRSVKPSRLVVGLMSGTSADSIDVAICRMRGQQSDIAVELIHYAEHAHDPRVKCSVLKSSDLGPRNCRIERLARGDICRGLSTLAQASIDLAGRR